MSDENSHVRGRDKRRGAKRSRASETQETGEILRMNKIDWKKATQDGGQFQRIFCAKTVREQDWDKKEYCANMAVFGAKHVGFVEADKRRRQKARPEDAFSAIMEHSGQYSSAEDGDLETSWCIESKIVTADDLPWYGYISDADREASFPSFEDSFDAELLAELRRISEESQILRMTVAWFLWKSCCINRLTDEQAACWEKDFQLFDILAGEGRDQTGVWVLEYAHVSSVAYYDRLDYLKRILSKFRRRYLTCRKTPCLSSEI